MNMKINKIIENIKSQLSNTETNTLAVIPIFFGFIIMLAWVLLYKETFTGKPIEILAVEALLISWGISGFVYFMRKESPGFFFKVKGKMAMLTGLIIMSVCWGLAILVALKFMFGII
jgi:hypothetical protein